MKYEPELRGKEAPFRIVGAAKGMLELLGTIALFSLLPILFILLLAAIMGTSEPVVR